MKKLLRKYSLLLAVSFVAIIVLLSYGYFQYNKGVEDTHFLKSDFQIKASALIEQFQANETTADEKYSNKIVTVHGIVKTIQRTDSSSTILLNDGSASASVICQFENDSKQELRRLEAGQDVVVKGVCTGYLMDVIIVRCVLQ